MYRQSETMSLFAITTVHAVAIAWTLQNKFGMASVPSLIVGAIAGFVLSSIEFALIAKIFKP